MPGIDTKSSAYRVMCERSYRRLPTFCWRSAYMGLICLICQTVCENLQKTSSLRQSSPVVLAAAILQN